MVVCQFCHELITTKPRYLVGIQAMVCSLAFVCTGLFQGCCLLPLILKEWKDVAHYCPSCLKQVGYYIRSSS
ncbi:hypothetical protein ACOMHN_019487 [Nucella lapillus]